METQKKNIAVIDPEQKGIVYENYSKFESSIFYKVYDKAKDLTVQIIERNRELQKVKNHGNDFRNKEQVDNIIAFLGRRGTGKTSAMLSFMEGLKDHHKHHDVIRDDEAHLDFISLEWIDASLMEENEDIFETILAKMFGELLKRSDKTIGSRKSDLEYDYRTLYQQFENIYQRVVNLKNKEFDEEILINVLKNHSRSTEIRVDFAKLVKSYIRFLEDAGDTEDRRRERERETYLVIAIDDIDLNVKHGYDILETIHRYLMVPGVIVLVAINYEEMLLCCEKRYVNSYRNLPEIVVEDIGKRAIQMSEEYLEKVLPPYMRVYLPSLKKTDFELKESRKIKVSGQEYSIKKGMFHIIWEKTKVFYDTQGKKRHFMEPVTLRNLSTNFQLYHNMDALPDQNNENFQKIYDENYCKVIDDILFRFACDYLPNKEYQLFMRWSEENNVRRGQEIVEQVVSSIDEWSLEDFGNIRNADMDHFKDDYRVWGYSYGELLRSLYCMSRKTELDKKLVHVVLAQYTVVFTRIFEFYKIYELKNPDQKNTPNKNTLMELMGQSVGGSWAKYVLPRVNIEEGAKGEESYWSAYRYQNGSEITLCKADKNSEVWSVLQKIINRKSLEDELTNLLKTKEIDVIKVWIFFFSFYAGKSRFKGDMLEINRPTEGVQEYSIKFKGGGIEFNIFNFVQNSFNYREVVRNYYISVVKAVCRYARIEMEDAEVESCIEQIIKNQMKDRVSFLYRFNKWTGKYGGLALPVYNFDITYNLIKRQVIHCKEENTGYIESEAVYDYICALFDRIHKSLEEQDKAYIYVDDKTGSKKAPSNFAGCFWECPIVNCIVSDSAEGKQKYRAFMDGYARISYSNNTNQDRKKSVDELKTD